MSTVLVTGATGLVGNNVVRLLLTRSEPVRVLVRSHFDVRPLAGLDIEIVQGDVRDRESVRRAVDGVQRVVHAAAVVRIGRSGLTLQRAINTEGTRNVAAAARDVGARMVHVSTCDAIGPGTPLAPADEDTPIRRVLSVPYVITKREAERAVREEIARGLEAVIVNPAFMLGPWDWKPSSGQMLVAVARGLGWFAPRGEFNVCDVRDVAAGILAALDRGQCGRRYILAGRAMSCLEAWTLFAELAGVRKPLCRVGPVAGWLAGRIGDMQGWLLGSEPNINSGAIAMARLPKHYSSARATAELAYHMRPARETIADALQWFRQFGYLAP